jgi:hypothetical protein
MRRAGSWWSSGALDEAQSIWGAAAEAGDTEAAFNLGVLPTGYVYALPHAF